MPIGSRHHSPPLTNQRFFAEPVLRNEVAQNDIGLRGGSLEHPLQRYRRLARSGLLLPQEWLYSAIPAFA